MLKYNGTHNLVTTDDVTLGGNINPNLGKDLSEILEEQAKEIQELRSNIKWIAKYGGIGGKGGGSSEGTTKTKFNVTISYVDLNGTNQTTVTTHKALSLAPILAKAGSKVTVTISITSIMSPDIAYSAVFNINGASSSKAISTLTRYTSFSFIASDTSYTCQLTINGENSSRLDFNTYTQIYVHNIQLVSGTNLFPNNSSIGPVYINDLKLDTEITNLVPELFDLTFKEASLNGTNIPTDFNQLVAVGQIFKEGGYGLYNLIVKFIATNSVSGLEYEGYINYMYVYKEADKVFIYVYSDSNEVSVYNKDTIVSPSGTDLRNIPLKFRIYGLLTDTVLASYKMYVKTNKDDDFVESETLYTVNLEYAYNISNTSVSETYEKLTLTFLEPNSQVSINYYIWVKNPGSVNYIFTTSGNKLCYGATGDNTDANPLNGSVAFPAKIGGSPYWTFSEAKNNIISLNPSILPVGPVLKDDPLDNIGNYLITPCVNNGDSILYDTIINIGLNYKDSSYDNPIITIDDNNRHIINICRSKIEYDGTSTDKFGIPDDGKFHLLTIYLKYCYNININGSSWGIPSPSFAVYVDGVLDVKPTLTAFAVSKETKISFFPGKTEYNFFGVNILNPVTTDVSHAAIYSDIVKRYVCDYDPILVSNFYMCYANTHFEDLGLSSAPFSVDQMSMMNRSIYTGLTGDSANYINYLTTEGNVYNKFISVLMDQFVLLLSPTSTIPLFRIVPRYSDETSVKNGLHTSIQDTLTSYGEDETGDFKSGWECEFQRYDTEKGWVPIIDSAVIDGITHNPRFKFKFQGSSTLLYSVKNFEISTMPFTDESRDIEYQYYFNPDTNVFKYPETSFNLKADLVDSSSCTNNVIGNFVNDYMTSPFGADYKACLSGRPILLFILNNIGSGKGGENLFLGIYNLNLNRSSLNNLGYQKLPEDLEKITSQTFNNIYYSITTKNTDIIPNPGTVVAEVQGNGNVYDFSLYDLGLLNKIYDDFFVVDNGRITNNYSTALQTMSRDFAYYVKSKILTYGDNEVFPRNDYGLSNPSNYTNMYEELKLNYPDRLYYYNGTTLTKIPEGAIIVTTNSIDESDFYSYKLKNATDKSIVGNVDYLFHIVYDRNGESINEVLYNSSKYYYVEHINPVYNPETHINKIDLKTALKYYMVCMAFAMVDSVQKNLNIKKANNNPTWYPLFYDMDTALALDNAGANSNYKAFSDYITDEGKIISDFVDKNEEAWFDIPSSYLFMYAKYDALLNHLDGGDPLKYTTPLEYWLTLRGVTAHNTDKECEGALINADTFCNNYLYKYLEEDIPPIIWNLNYMYKYFSFTNNVATGDNAENADTEDKRFNGKMIYRRRTWLNQRFHYLDALFGIMNNRSIGSSGIAISTEVPKPTSNPDIELITEMFPSFTKGVTSKTINVQVSDLPRTPLIMLTSTNEYILYITDGSGRANIKNNINSATDIGFFGTKHLKTVSDCGQFLVLGNNKENTIKGDLITSIYIKSSCSDITLNLNDVPSVSEIIIGNQGAAIRVDRGIRIIGNAANKPEIKLVLNKVQASTISISDCILNKGSVISEINPINTSLALTLSGVTVRGALNVANSGMTNTTLNSCLFEDDITLNSQYEGDLNMNSSSNNGSKVFTVSIDKLTKIKLENCAIHNFRHLSSWYLNSCEVDFTGSISANTEFCLNYNQAQGKAISGFSASTGNLSLKSITLKRTGKLYTPDIVLRLPGFTALTTLNLTGHFCLGKGGICGSLISSINVPKIGSNTGNGIVKLAANADWAFAVTKCTFTHSLGNVGNLWLLLLLGVTSANYLMHVRGTRLSIEECAAILGSIKQYNLKCSIEGLLSNNTIYVGGTPINNLNIVTILTYLDLLASIYPTNALSRGSFVFFRTNVRYLNKNLASKLGTEYINFMGASGYTNYIETGALNSFSKILEMQWAPNRADNSWSAYEHHPSTQFYTFIDNVFEIVEEVKYAEEFAACEELYVNITTNNNISFDFGEGMGNKIRYYGGVCQYNSYIANHKNILNMFNGTTSLTSVSQDFLSQSRITSVDDERVVDLFAFLTLNGGTEINTKAYNVLSLPSSTTATSTSHIQFGSFTKKITAANFKKLLLLFVNKKYRSINNIFYNCYITDIPSDAFFQEAFFGVLSEFSTINCAFMGSVYRNTSGSSIPLNLNNAFLKKNAQEEIILSGNLTLMVQAFQEVSLQPFEDIDEENGKYGLGLASGIVQYAEQAFCNCSYHYPTVSLTISTSNATYKSYIQDFPLPTEAYSRSLLPKNFLRFCRTNDTGVTRLMFYNSSYGVNHLTGYLPEITKNSNRTADTNYFGNNILFNDTFRGCNVYYHLIETNCFTIFPAWFCNFSKGDLKFNVYIPLPLTNTVGGKENYKCSIFGENSDIVFSGNYGPLPRYPELKGWSTYLTTGYTGIETPLYLTLEASGELPYKGSYFVRILPLSIVPSVVATSDSTIVTDVTTNTSLANYKPIHELEASGLTRAIIFRGVLNGLGTTALDLVISC